MTVILRVQLGVLSAMLLTGVIAVADGGAAPIGDVIQFGALGLCGLMIYQNDRNRRDLVAVIGQQQAEIKQRDERLERLHVETLDAIRKCSGTRL